MTLLYRFSGSSQVIMESVATILGSTAVSLAIPNHTRTSLSSIEDVALIKSPNSIEIPGEIDALIDNKMFRNKFKSLIKRGFLQELVQLAEIAQKKERPSHWFAKVTAKAMWERTLKFLEECQKVAQIAAEVAEKLGTIVSRPILKVCWKIGTSAYKLAAQAKESGRKPLHLFLWLGNRT